MNAMILAAGRGERLRPFTDHTPKPLLAIGGERLVERQLRALARAGAARVVINLGWLGDQVRRHVGDGEGFGVPVVYSDEGTPPLETGGGVFRALPWLGPGPFLLVNGDVWTDFEPAALAAPSGEDRCTLLLVPNPPDHPAGDFGLAGDRVVAAAAQTLTFAGVSVLTPALFEGCRPGRFPLGPLLQAAVRAGHARGQRYDGAWFDAGSRARVERIERYLAARRAGDPRDGD